MGGALQSLPLPKGGKGLRRCPPTTEVGLVPLLEDILGDLLVVGALVQAVAPQGVLLDDDADQLARLTQPGEAGSGPLGSPSY